MSRLSRAFGTISKPVCQDPTISLPAKGLYALLCAHAGSNDEGICWPSVATLASELGCSRTTVKRLLAELVKAEVIVREPRYSDGRQTSSDTRLIDAHTAPRGGVTSGTPVVQSEEGVHQ